MQGRSKRERTLIILCLIVVPGIILWGILTPSGGATGKKTLVPKDAAVRERREAIQQASVLQDQNEQLQAHIGALTYSLPGEDLIPHVIHDLQDIAAKSGVHLRAVKPLRAKALPLGAGSRVSMEVQFRAEFEPNVVRFLYYVEAPDSKRVVDKLNITSADARFKTVDVSAQVTVFTRSAAGAAPVGGDTGSANIQSNGS